MKNLQLIILLLIGISTLNSCNKDDCKEMECVEQTWYQDTDGDGFGDLNNSQQSCTQPTGFVIDNSDPDDTDATIYPDAEEICDDGIDNNGNGEIDECLTAQITGNWSDNFGDNYSITSSEITITSNNSVFHILDSGIDYTICFNDVDNAFNPELYSKFEYTEITEDSFYFCQIVYDGVSQMYAEDPTNTADPDDLVNGCDGFAWSLMTRD